jgi:hypothetical protein
VATKPTQRGRLTKSIQVLTDHAGSSPLRLEVRMDVQLPIEVLPAPRLYLQALVTGGASEQVLVRRTDGRPLEVADPVSRVGAWVDFEFTRVESTRRLDNGLEARPGDVVITAKVRQGTEAISRTGTLQLRTNHALRPVLEIPVTLRVRPMVELRPSEVRLVDGSTRPGAASTIVRVVHNSGAGFRVRSVEVADPATVEAGPATDGERSTHNVWIRVAPVEDGVARSYPLRTEVTVFLENAGRESVTLPVVVASP